MTTIAKIKNNTIILENLRSDETIKQSIDLLEGDVLDCNIKINTWNTELTTLLEEQKTANNNYSAMIQESNEEANKVRYKWEDLIRTTNTKYEAEKQTVNAEYSLKLDSNPEFTGEIEDDEFKVTFKIAKRIKRKIP